MDSGVTDPGKERRLAAGIPVVPAFDGYRAYAILGIVALHVLLGSGVLAPGERGWASVLVTGTLGQLVDVLFIVSGFVVFLPTAARGGEFGRVRAYALRRAARLVPAYWLALVVALALIALVPVHPALAFPGITSIAAHAAFLHTPGGLLYDFPLGFGVDGPVWTLSLEVTFYALLPLIAQRYQRHPLAGLAVAAVVTAGWHEALSHFGAVTSALGAHPSAATSVRIQTSALIQFPFFAFSFALGMTGAWAYVRLRSGGFAQLARRVRLVQLGSLAALGLCGYLVGHAGRDAAGLGAEAGRRGALLSLAYSASLATLMVSTALAGAAGHRPFTHPAARRLGDVSYGVYLISFVVITFTVRALFVRMGLSADSGGFTRGDGSLTALVVLAAIAVPLSLAYGYASARIVEQPLRRQAARWGRRHEPAGAQAADAQRGA